MATVNIHDAKTQFSRLLARVESGEEIVIGRAGVPVARLVPYQRRTEPREPGGWAGKVWMADDFDELPDEVQRAFDGLDP
ncbi:MAG TPA: type II toxin-antitoxin system Phd/YefM family antitoxin [Mycobacteriales bacterium]|jgi:prevent-host-death family protein|nr:type II toxin-antitoxin system Phd/YefM family antitoxin [Mycobacteriales bacterium]